MLQEKQNNYKHRRIIALKTKGEPNHDTTTIY